jgi:uncharacterized protein YebE (UPF0316 family)
MEKNKKSIWQDALKPGLILSLIFVIFSVIVYVFNLATINLFAGILTGLISLLLFVISMFLLIKAYRNEKLNGFISYGKALGFGIIIGLYASFVLTGYTYVFNNIIDKDYEKNVSVKMQQLTEEYMISKGVPDEMIEDQMAKIGEQAQKSPIKKLIYGFLGTFILSFIAALIAGAIAKKNQDPYLSAMQEVEE